MQIQTKSERISEFEEKIYEYLECSNHNAFNINNYGYYDQFQSIIQENITKNVNHRHRIQYCLTTLSDSYIQMNNDNQIKIIKLSTPMIKIIGQFYQADHYFQMLRILNGFMYNNNTEFFRTISDTVGKLVYEIYDNQNIPLMKQSLLIFLQNFEISKGLSSQIRQGSGDCIYSIIKNTNHKVLIELNCFIIDEMLNVIESIDNDNLSTLIECLFSLTTQLRFNFSQYNLMEFIQKLLSNTEKKIKTQILQLITNACRYDTQSTIKNQKLIMTFLDRYVIDVSEEIRSLAKRAQSSFKQSLNTDIIQNTQIETQVRENQVIDKNLKQKFDLKKVNPSFLTKAQQNDLIFVDDQQSPIKQSKQRQRMQSPKLLDLCQMDESRFTEEYLMRQDEEYDINMSLSQMSQSQINLQKFNVKNIDDFVQKISIVIEQQSQIINHFTLMEKNYSSEIKDLKKRISKLENQNYDLNSKLESVQKQNDRFNQQQSLIRKQIQQQELDKLNSVKSNIDEVQLQAPQKQMHKRCSSYNNIHQVPLNKQCQDNKQTLRTLKIDKILEDKDLHDSQFIKESRHSRSNSYSSIQQQSISNYLQPSRPNMNHQLSQKNIIQNDFSHFQGEPTQTYKQNKNFNTLPSYNNMNTNQRIIEQIDSHLADNKINEAFGLAMTQQDRIFLIYLLQNQNLPYDCLNVLNSSHFEFLITKMRNLILIKDMEIINLVLDWLYNCYKQRYNDINSFLTRSIISSLQQTKDENQIKMDQPMMKKLQKIIDKFKKMLLK